MKRSQPLKRTPLRPSLKGLGSSRSQPLRRGGRLHTRKVSRRFAKRRDPAYCRWIRALPCEAEGHDCTGNVQAAHVTHTRATGAYDRGEVVPLCVHHHREQEGRTRRFNVKYHTNLGDRARELLAEYEAEFLALRPTDRSGP